MNLIPKRRRQIARAAFDLYVLDKLINEGLVGEDGKIEIRYLNNAAKEVGCKAHSLSIAIMMACRRLISDQPKETLPPEEEAAVLLAVAKYRIKEISVPLKNFKREFGNVTADINERYPGLHLKTAELFQYVYPIYVEVIDEVFGF
ncbi:MAG: hypothetical protein WAW11_02595 [Patescibacteria group bacterium]